MEPKHHPLRDYFKLVLFVIGWMELFLLLFGLLFGGVLGYKNALTVCFWFGVLLLAVFLSIILANLLWIGILELYDRILRKKNDARQDLF